MTFELKRAIYLFDNHQYDEAFKMLNSYQGDEDRRLYYYLGQCYLYGYGTSKNIKKAKECLSRANDDPDALYLLASIYQEEGDNINASKYYKLSFTNGNLIALDILFKEAKKKEEKNELIKFLLPFKKEENAYALKILGDLYLATRKYDKAIESYHRSALLGDVSSAITLAVFYEDGKYVASDIKKADYYYRLASSNNDEHPTYLLGVFYFKQKDYLSSLEIFNRIPLYLDSGLYILKIYQLLERDDEYNSFRIYLATNGNIVVAKELGDYYLSISNDKEAFKYYKLAYDPSNDIYHLRSKLLSLASKNIKAIINNNLEEERYALSIYLSSSSYKKEIDRLIKKDISSLEDKDKYFIGYLYIRGIYLPLNKSRGEEYLSSIIKESKYYIYKDVISYIFGTSKTYINGVKAYSRLLDIEEEDEEYFYLAGLIYEYGYGIDQDINKAYQYYLKSNSLFSLIKLDELSLLNDFKLDKEKRDLLSSLLINKDIIDNRHIYLSYLKERYRYLDFIDKALITKNLSASFIYPPLNALIPYLKEEGIYLSNLIYKGDDYHFDLSKDYHYGLVYQGLIKEKDDKLASIKIYEEAYLKYDVLEALRHLNRLDNKKYDNKYLLDNYYKGDIDSLYLYAVNKYNEGKTDLTIYNYFSMLSRMNNMNALLYVGVMYYLGIVVDKDVTIGKDYIELAMNNGADIYFDFDKLVILNK